MSRVQPWIAVDLDGTLAEYGEWLGFGVIGAPIPLMVERVKRWLAQGKTVKIFTARVACGENDDPADVETSRLAIEIWCNTHIGRILPVTNKKDYGMVELWDDRAVAVIPNTGIIIGDHRRDR